MKKKTKVVGFFVFTLGYSLVAGGLLILLGGRIDYSDPLALIMTVVILTFILLLLFIISIRYVNRLSFLKQFAMDRARQEFVSFLSDIDFPEEIFERLCNTIIETCKPTSLLLYRTSPKNGEYCLHSINGSEAIDGICFSPDGFLAQILAGVDFYEPNKVETTLEKEDQARIDLLASQIIIPIKNYGHLAGWLALGKPSGRNTFDKSEVHFLQQMCSRAGMVLQRIHSGEMLRRIEKEQNVLTRVAQGISFTVEFDDILELITSQASQIIIADDFRITLYQTDQETYFHAFVLQEDERLQELENRPLDGDVGLELIVIQSQRPLITNDYARECRMRGKAVAVNGIFAWMGIPLNAGAETIGVFSIASRDEEVKFAQEQETLLQAIADLTAGAIVNSRLLEESQHRAAQLVKLNELSLDLTSTLELQPLFTKIIQNSTAILGCQAGYLLLVDPSSTEITLEAGYGAMLRDQIGTTISEHAGLIGYAALDGSAKIFLPGQNECFWGDRNLLEDGIKLNGAMAIPMRIHDRVVGSIVVINKSDGGQFTLSDQEWLTAFINQATIAIENARLYTLTDRALAERVDELSVMQKIDQQLNASLEVESALEITLHWALKQTEADYGMAGVVDGQSFFVIARRGYLSGEIGLSSNGLNLQNDLVLKFPAVQSAMLSGQVQVLECPDDFVQFSSFPLTEVYSQVVVPIVREKQAIGLLILESKKSKAFSKEILSFLSRLSDHTAIALANATLFSEVREANISKSRFVSFVAHELKNPMASIKGYTELVASGMAGPVTDMQASFLATVRSNVERMNTIVSDLNDLTKIQVGNLKLEQKPVSLADTLQEVTRLLQRQIDEKELVLAVEIPEDLPLVWADIFRLSQILTNLISNATKYTPSGGEINVGVELAPELEPDSSTQIHLWVQDRGIGISYDDQKKIFQQYFRTDAAKEMASGTGLGLNLTKSLVELHGGRIWFESEPGVGSTFHLTLPSSQPETLKV